jgi:hypothetical protein
VGFDTDRSHSSFTRFYEGFASPVVVDSYEGLDTVVNGFETRPQQSVIVDLAAQTLAPLARWIKDSDLFDVFAELGVTVNFWHVLDDGKDSSDLLGTLVDTFGNKPNTSWCRTTAAATTSLCCSARSLSAKPPRTGPA